MLQVIMARSTGDGDAGSGGVLALLTREGLLARRMRIAASLLWPLLTLALRPPLPVSLPDIGASSTARLGWPGPRTSFARHSQFRSLETRRPFRLTFWWLSLLAAMNSRLSRLSFIV